MAVYADLPWQVRQHDIRGVSQHHCLKRILRPAVLERVDDALDGHAGGVLQVPGDGQGGHDRGQVDLDGAKTSGWSRLISYHLSISFDDIVRVWIKRSICRVAAIRLVD